MIFGVPEAILSKIERRVAKLGLPIEIGSIHLSVYGWRSSDVRIYSSHPDDLDPVVAIQEIIFKRTQLADETDNPDLEAVSVRASGITLCPSVRWCTGLSAESSFRHVEDIRATVALSPGQVGIHEGFFEWQGIQFNINGTVLTGFDKPPEEEPLQTHPIAISEPLQLAVEHTLDALERSESAVLDLNFRFDATDPVASQASLSAKTDSIVYRGVHFSGSSIELSYENRIFRVNRIAVERDNEAFAVGAEYAVDSRMTQLWLTNEISSKRMFLLIPDPALEWLVWAGFRPESFPTAELRIGPARPEALLGKMTGSVALKNTAFRGLEISSLAGNLERAGNRLELSDIKGDVRGQPNRSDAVGSCLIGGAVSGSAFWDSMEGEFGFSSASVGDPNLLVEPLSMVPIATNVIRRFRFDDQPPRIWFELSANYYDWDSLIIHARAVTEDMRLHDVPLSSLTGLVTYQNGILELDSIVAQQGIDYLKGSCALDFSRGAVSFDAAGSINPKSIEDVVYSGNGLFTDKIKVSGPTKLEARGKVDWRHMRDTEFRAELEADQVELPMAVLDDFSATVSGSGPVVAVSDAVFNVYGGQGSGSFSVRLDPATDGIPYAFDVGIINADFKRCLKGFNPQEDYRVTGEFTGALKAEADFSGDFLETAEGAGSVRVRHGQLADLPLFKGFSVLIRKVIPSFAFFSINSLSGDFVLKNGMVYSENAYFDGDILSAKGRGSYSRSNGFDAYVQAQIMSDNNISKIFRFLTDPLLKLFEMKLEGTLEDPQWKMEPFSGAGRGKALSE